jgi:hypothetical protein
VDFGTHVGELLIVSAVSATIYVCTARQILDAISRRVPNCVWVKVVMTISATDHLISVDVCAASSLMGHEGYVDSMIANIKLPGICARYEQRKSD